MTGVSHAHTSTCRPIWIDGGSLTPSMDRSATTVMSISAVAATMCKYCAYNSHEGWDQLLQYDATYQSSRKEAENYGFHESRDDLREQFSTTD